MQRLTDQQWHDAFRPANYATPTRSATSAGDKEKIADGLALRARPSIRRPAERSPDDAAASLPHSRVHTAGARVAFRHGGARGARASVCDRAGRRACVPSAPTRHAAAIRPVIETQIVLAVVGATVMLVVGSSLARAFGIVGAANLIRYRAKIDDPKDAVVMLSTLSLGLCCGVELYGLARSRTCSCLPSSGRSNRLKRSSPSTSS